MSADPFDPDPQPPNSDVDDGDTAEPDQVPTWVTMAAGELCYEQTGYWVRFQYYDNAHEVIAMIQGTLKSVFHCTPNVVISLGAGKGGSSEWTLDPYDEVQFHNFHTDYATEKGRKENLDVEAP